jgi:uncharacterized protein YcaQ
MRARLSVTTSSQAISDLDDVRAFAVRRSLFTPTTLRRAIRKLGFVQADPIRAPARAQDLTLRHRVKGYRAGDLDRQYSKLDVEEDFFINYGFMWRPLQVLMHPRGAHFRWSRPRRRRAQALLEFVRERGNVHPREVDRHFAHGTVTNYWGGLSSATTHLLDDLHYRGLLRVVRREGGIRIYASREYGPGPTEAARRRAHIDALVDVLVRTYAPLPGRSLSHLVSRLRFAVPQWRRELKPALQRARHRLSHACVNDVDWYWPAGERLKGQEPDDTVRLLAPFDPLVWDRHRFELLWDWTYRFEAYTPQPKRKFGYYALPLLWRDRVVGWGNLSVKSGELQSTFGYIHSLPPRDRRFKRELDAELHRMRAFLDLSS